jgi:serine/threonine-protein kinase HipA
MPSDECFVYITLPGQTEPVTAGKYQLDIDRQGRAVGQFVYGKSYLSRDDRVEFDPVELKLRVPSYRTTKLRGNFGALRDSSPDAWGRKLIEKRLGNLAPTEIEYLLNSPDDRAGALGFGLGVQPPAPARHFNRTLDLGRLIAIADQIVAAEKDPEAPKPAGADAEQAELLLQAGTSMGGARPKATVEDDEGLWLAKFTHPDDRWNNPRVEHAMLVLARNCGLSSAESRLEKVDERDVILVKRFDRHKTDKGYRRCRMVSALTLIDAEDTADTPDKREKWSYLLLADEIRRANTDNQLRDLPELFRRICFNALISNTDDHPRNHAVIATDAAWSLSPAYDLTPNPMIALGRRDLAMTFGDWGRYANRTNLLSQCQRFLVTKDEAALILDEMTATVSNTWYGVARQAGVSERDCELIRSAFAYEGFGYDLTDPQIHTDGAEELPTARSAR